MKIRKSNIDDAKSIVEVHVDTWKSSYRGLINNDILEQRTVSEDRIEKIRLNLIYLVKNVNFAQVSVPIF